MVLCFVRFRCGSGGSGGGAIVRVGTRPASVHRATRGGPLYVSVCNNTTVRRVLVMPLAAVQNFNVAWTTMRHPCHWGALCASLGLLFFERGRGESRAEAAHGANFALGARGCGLLLG